MQQLHIYALISIVHLHKPPHFAIGPLYQASSPPSLFAAASVPFYTLLSFLFCIQQHQTPLWDLWSCTHLVSLADLPGRRERGGPPACVYNYSYRLVGTSQAQRVIWSAFTCTIMHNRTHARRCSSLLCMTIKNTRLQHPRCSIYGHCLLTCASQCELKYN